MSNQAVLCSVDQLVVVQFSKVNNFLLTCNFLLLDFVVCCVYKPYEFSLDDGLLDGKQYVIFVKF